MPEKLNMRIEQGAARLSLVLPPSKAHLASRVFHAFLEERDPPEKDLEKEDRCSEEDFDDGFFMDDDYRLSNELKRTPVYKEVKQRLKCYKHVLNTYKIDIHTEVIQEDRGVGAREIPDWGSWRNTLQRIPNAFQTKNLKHYLIHVSGRVSREDKRRIADQIESVMPMVANTTILTESKSDQIVVELVGYGADLEKRFGFRDEPW